MRKGESIRIVRRVFLPLALVVIFFSVLAGSSWAAATYSTATGQLFVPCADMLGQPALDVNLASGGGLIQVGMIFTVQNFVKSTVVCDTPSFF